MLRFGLIFFFSISSLSASDIHQHPTIQSMLSTNNKLRIQNNLLPHLISPELTKAAQNQAWYMAKTHDFEHKTKKNGSPGLRAAKFGYSGIVRENIARNYDKIPLVFKKWKDSPEHWRSIIGDFTEVGFGHAIAEDGTVYWVALYGLPRKLQWIRQQHSLEFKLASRSPQFLLISHQ